MHDRPMPFASSPLPPDDAALALVATVLDPVLVPLGFAPGQAGTSGSQGQVIFCRGFEDSLDEGCVDLVIDLCATPEWQITDVRFWGFPAERWHLRFQPDDDLATQLGELVRTLPIDLR
jgi:hypothetical protein